MGENYFCSAADATSGEGVSGSDPATPGSAGCTLELGLVYAGSAEWTKAEEVFRTEVKLQPGKAEAFYRLGFALLQQGKGRRGSLGAAARRQATARHAGNTLFPGQGGFARR